MKYLKYILLFIFLTGTANAYITPDRMDYGLDSGVSNVHPGTAVGSTTLDDGTGVSVFTDVSGDGLAFFTNTEEWLLSGDSTFGIRGLDNPYFFNSGSSRWVYDDDTDTWVHVADNALALRVWPNNTKGMIFVDCASGTSNLIYHSGDMTQADWDKTTMTTALTQTDIFGRANSATLLTATAGNATVFQPIVKSAEEHTAMFMIKRVTGTGTIEMTVDGGASYLDITSSLSTSTWFTGVTSQTPADPSIGIRIVTNGDAIIVGHSQLSELTSGQEPIALPTDASISIYTTSSGMPYMGMPDGLSDMLAEDLGAEANLNTDFDADADDASPAANWSHVGNHTGTVQDDDAAPPSAPNVYEIVATGAGSSANRIRTDTLSVSTNELFKVSFWAKWVSGVTDVYIVLGSTFSPIITLTDSWVKYERYGVNAGGSYLQVRSTGTITWRMDDISLTKVQNARISDKELLGPHGTMVFDIVPYVDADDLTTYGGLVAWNDAYNAGIYVSSSGRIAMYDGTTTVYGGATSGVSKFDQMRIIGQWGYLDTSNVAKMRICVDRGDGIECGSEGNYDGDMGPGGNGLQLFKDGTGRFDIGPIWIFNRKADDIWAWGSP